MSKAQDTDEPTNPEVPGSAGLDELTAPLQSGGNANSQQSDCRGDGVSDLIGHTAGSSQAAGAAEAMRLKLGFALGPAALLAIGILFLRHCALERPAARAAEG